MSRHKSDASVRNYNSDWSTSCSRDVPKRKTWATHVPDLPFLHALPRTKARLMISCYLVFIFQLHRPNLESCPFNPQTFFQQVSWQTPHSISAFLILKNNSLSHTLSINSKHICHPLQLLVGCCKAYPCARNSFCVNYIWCKNQSFLSSVIDFLSFN